MWVVFIVVFQYYRLIKLKNLEVEHAFFTPHLDPIIKVNIRALLKIFRFFYKHSERYKEHD
jgi:hypothetical protein